MPLVLNMAPTVFSLVARESFSAGFSCPSLPAPWWQGCRWSAMVDAVPLIWAEDEEADEDEDLPEAEVVPSTEPLETTSDFDEDDFDDEFDDDFEEEFDEDEFGAEVTPEDLELGEDDDPFENTGGDDD